MAVMALALVLGLASAVVQARKGQWWRAGAVFLPIFGLVVMLLGSVERQIAWVFWLGFIFVVAGFGAEAMTYWKTRTLERARAGR